jgi:hypothetical protein
MQAIDARGPLGLESRLQAVSPDRLNAELQTEFSFRKFRNPKSEIE